MAPSIETDDEATPVAQNFKTRTRSELLDFLCLVFSIRVPCDAALETADDIASATGVAPARVRSLVESRVIRPRSSQNPGFSTDDARLAALVSTALDLGCLPEDLEALTDPRDDRCSHCKPSDCASGCEVIIELRTSFSKYEYEAALSPDPTARARSQRLRHAINSIDTLIDLV
jgi:hypothetical protein